MNTDHTAVPNILILNADEHNPLISSVYGHPFVKTPNMERLARMGTVYQSAYCASPLCCPTRSAFFAGRPVHQIQTYNNCITSEFEYLSYGQVLKEQGVHTVHIGKVHGYRAPNELGFSEMYGKEIKKPGDINIRRNPLKIRPLQALGGGARHTNFGIRENPTEQDDTRIESAIRWLREKGSSLEKPWTLSVNTDKPHFPMFTTEELWDMYAEHADLPAYGVECEPAQHPHARDLRAHFQTAKFPNSSIRGLRQGYYAHVTYIDRKLGELLDVLEATGLMENTLIVYTSDHGELLGKFGMWWKCSLYEDSARIPLIVAGPGFKQHHIVHTPVDQFDLLATIFRALNCSRPEGGVGTPLQDIADNDPDHVAFSEYHGHGTRASSYMIRKAEWKYIYYCEGPDQLFHIDSDPDEQVNLIEKYPDKAAELNAELRKICDPEKENKRAEAFINQQLQDIEKMNLILSESGHAVVK